MKRPYLWTLMVWAIAAVGYWLMATVGNVPVARFFVVRSLKVICATFVVET